MVPVEKVHTVLLVVIGTIIIRRRVMYSFGSCDAPHFLPSMIVSKQYRHIIYKSLFKGAYTTTSRFCSHSRVFLLPKKNSTHQRKNLKFPISRS
jgi:hypothetical protein